ncbi:MAG: 3-oxo-5-alpha-steroid 4-dehydrogenase [Gammaproteobacteria bacterium]|nr:3-oxo-5-alpha-steroid 4-dehydrogenase [Gammaproteobacteria bacterium]
MKQKHFIDSHKGVNAIAVIALIAWYEQWHNTTAWIYLALHGTYGFLWVMKSRFFGDKSWEAPTGLAYGLFIWFGLSLYWVGPWLITSRGFEAPPWYLGLCISLYAFGVFFHFTSDIQKHLLLKHRPGALITEGLWSLSRNPNYFGELLIYLGFTMLAMHWAPLLVLALFIAFIWVPNMIRKDKSLSRYEEFAAYKKRTRMFIPFII